MYESIAAAENEASPLVKRQARREGEFRYIIMRCVFDASSAADLKARLKADLFSLETYAELPKYRIIALENYMHGLLDAVARMQGAVAPAISLEKPKPSERRKKLHDQIEALRLTNMPNVPTQAAPGWAVPAARQESGVMEVPKHRDATNPPPRRRVVEVQAERSSQDARQEPQSKAPPAHRVIGGQRRTFRPSRRLR